MIPIEELRSISVQKNLTLKNAEKDYLLDICLFSISKYRSALAFKGGTALYKFHNLNRFSEDLDFTMNKKKFKMDEMDLNLIRSLDHLGIGANTEDIQKYQNEINITLLARGPLYDGSKGSATRIAINISLRERPQNVQRSMYIPVYKELVSYELHVLDINEMLAEKVRAIITREKPRDVYDTWFLLRKGAKMDMALVKKKLKIYDMKFERRVLNSRIEEKRINWKRDMAGLIIGQLPDFDLIIGEIHEKL